MLTRFTLVLIFACALSQATDGRATAKTGGVAIQQNRNSISQRGSVWMWNRDEDGVSLEMTVRGEVEFNDDYTEVKRVADGDHRLGSLSRAGAVGPVEQRRQFQGGFARGAQGDRRHVFRSLQG